MAGVLDDAEITRILAITAHPDDVDFGAVGSAALDAVYPDARNPFAFPELREREGLAPWKVREVWLTGPPSPTHFVDVTATFSRTTWTAWRTASEAGSPARPPKPASPPATWPSPSRSWIPRVNPS
jgi:hypothetical protein